jgi:hypothetical protein
MGLPPSTICLAGYEGGFFLPLLGNEYEMEAWGWALRAFLYFMGLLYMFLGVAVVSDIFMEAIETITSQEYVLERLDPATGKLVRENVLVWVSAPIPIPPHIPMPPPMPPPPIPMPPPMPPPPIPMPPPPPPIPTHLWSHTFHASTGELSGGFCAAIEDIETRAPLRAYHFPLPADD